ncbi:hypothetical protein BFP76_07845 [Amylibacter kogurei]|uniref:3-hydroxyisobutyrate dehydrogenase n=1 Tax=Paramylibacter kogurei TaxID=1889778 RepID=A0A2G5K401_9RHOB|nr:DUF1932 domain-containing protein [Amylibacter kogurei]PIB23454.1 hypothetical protein BFP76_07845 [Amylibacter kogurei]
MNIAFIGFGEAACAFASTWATDCVKSAVGFDVKNNDPAQSAMMQTRFADHGVGFSDTLEMALANADVVFSLVTADCAHTAASDAAKHIKPDALFFDCNSCAPQTKQRSCDVINAAGGRYVDVAVMAPVHPARNKTPLLISGPDADDAVDVLQKLNLNPSKLDGAVGRASSVKMMRSVVIKGLEAILTECNLAAKTLGVEDLVWDSLEKSNPEFQWAAKADYMAERMAKHGVRRAAEMAEVAKTIAELGLPNDMATATTTAQARIGALAIDCDDIDAPALRETLINHLKN